MSNLLLVLMFVILSATPGILAVDYSVIDATTNIEAWNRFNTDIGKPFTLQTMDESARFIWAAFNQTYNKSVKQVSLYIADMAHDVEANTTNEKIYVSASYIERFKGKVKNEMKGIIYRQMTNVWQYNGKHKAPGYILNGIADFMRLKACLVRSDWPQPGGGNQWNESSTVTARFLDYWDYVLRGFVIQLNQKMKNGYRDRFLTEISDYDMDGMWDDYKANASRVLNFNCGHK